MFKVKWPNSSNLGSDSDIFFISRAEVLCNFVWVSSSLMLKDSKATYNQNLPERM